MNPNNNNNNNGFPFFNGFGFPALGGEAGGGGGAGRDGALGGGGAGAGGQGQFNGLPFPNVPVPVVGQPPDLMSALQTLQMQTMANQMMYGYMCQNFGFQNILTNQLAQNQPSVASSPFLSKPGLSVGQESTSSALTSSSPAVSNLSHFSSQSSTPGFQNNPPQSSTPSVISVHNSTPPVPSPFQQTFNIPPSFTLSTSSEKSEKSETNVEESPRNLESLKVATSSEIAALESSKVSESSESSTSSKPKVLEAPKSSESLKASESSLSPEVKSSEALTSSKKDSEALETFVSFMTSKSSEPSTSSKPKRQYSMADILESPENHIHFNDDGEDDVDKMFGISEKDDEVRKLPERQLSPITFTPTDSPEKAMTLDDIFGTGKENEKENFEGAKKEEQPKKIPIYRQPSHSRLSLESKKRDPNYDPFEFESDEDGVAEDYDDDEFGIKNLSVKKEVQRKDEEEAKKTTDKPKYIRGVGYEKKLREKVAEVKKESRADPDFFSIADRLRSEKEAEMECALFKITQSTSTECARDRGSVEPSESEDVVEIEPENASGSTRRRRSIEVEGNSSGKRNEEPKIQNLGPCIPEEFQKRLKMFAPADESLPKGTFLIFKPDILKPNCPIWRIDTTPCLIQKFDAFKDWKSGENVYRGGKTFSGWCPQVCTQYFRIQVKIVKKSTKFGIIVKPKIPFSQLFCAASIECFRNPRSFFHGSLIESDTENQGIDGSLVEPREIALEKLMSTFLVQVFNKICVMDLVEKNDFEYTRALTEIDLANWQCEELIEKRVRIGLRFRKWIGEFARIHVVNTGYYTLTKCQICTIQKSQRLVHFFDRICYTQNFEVKKCSKNRLVVDAILCEKCCQAVESLHKIQHLRLHVFRTCRDKLEEVGTTNSELSPTEMIKLAKADRKWMGSVIREYCSFWDRISMDFL